MSALWPARLHHLRRDSGSATVTDLLESPLMQSIFPDLYKHLKLVSSTPIRNMATHYGPLSYTVTGSPAQARYAIAPGVRVPAGGIVVMSPFARTPSRVIVNNQIARFEDGFVTVRTVPADVIFQY